MERTFEEQAGRTKPRTVLRKSRTEDKWKGGRKAREGMG